MAKDLPILKIFKPNRGGKIGHFSLKAQLLLKNGANHIYLCKLLFFTLLVYTVEFRGK